MLLSGAPVPGAQRFFVRVKEEVTRRSERDLGFRVSFSAGVASYPHDAGDPEGLIEAADFAMY